jgi:CTP:molybdopterin cytidylyltransferase MocA
LNKPNIHGLIVAAGLSGRMKSFKPLTDYKGKPFIINIILKLEVICDQIFIVTGHNEDDLKSAVINDITKANQIELLKKIFFVYNDSFQKGMFTSLQKGISAAKNCDWILYHFVDQPGLQSNFYTTFVNQIDSKHNWIQPSYKNKNAHPILIKSDLFDLIINSPSESSLREINKNSVVKRKFWECDYKEIFQDIDTEEDLSKLI